MTSEAKLIKRARTLDPAALAELYDRYAPKMYAYIYRRVGDAALAEDLTGELFVRVLQAIRNERAWRDSFVAWLYRIAHNLVIDHYRRRPPMPHVSLESVGVSGEGDSPDVEVEGLIERERLRAAIEMLTPEQQEVLALRFGEGLRVKEIANIMNKTPGAVQALQHRAVAALRRILTGEKYEEGPRST